MGTNVLNVSLGSAAPPTLHVYAHCGGVDDTTGIGLAIVNISPDEAQSVTLATPGPVGTERLEYHFSGTAIDGLHSHSIMLNGTSSH